MDISSWETKEERKRTQNRLAQRKCRKKRKSAQLGAAINPNSRHAAICNPSPPSSSPVLRLDIREVGEIELASEAYAERLIPETFAAPISNQESIMETSIRSDRIGQPLSWDEYHGLHYPSIALSVEQSFRGGYSRYEAERESYSATWAQASQDCTTLNPIVTRQILTNSTTTTNTPFTEEPNWLLGRIGQKYQDPGHFDSPSEGMESNNAQSYQFELNHLRPSTSFKSRELVWNNPQQDMTRLSLRPNPQGQPIYSPSKPSEIQINLEKTIEAARQYGFETFDELVTTYYTANLDENTPLGYAQSFSRSHHLTLLLRTIHESSIGWTERQRYSYKTELVKAAKSHYISEFRNLKRDAQISNETEAHRKLKSFVLNLCLDKEIYETLRYLQDKAPAIWSLITELIDANTVPDERRFATAAAVISLLWTADEN